MNPPLPFNNPNSLAPESVLKEQRIVSVKYFGFDEKFHTGEIIIHSDLIEDVHAFFELACEISFPIFSVIPIHKEPFYFDDISSCKANNSSGFNYRTILHSNQLSKHSYGRAFDINPVQNIYITYNTSGEEIYRLPEYGAYNPDSKGTLTAKHPLVLLMKDRGWSWGGDWTKESGRIDYQHFEKM